ncbi:MAG TPA: sigma-54 dependent transcriptional regulator [Bacteroidota bacterium]|nr:sigma-54 dependent transcriptional regulator [Bacteroidota bacterium]
MANILLVDDEESFFSNITGLLEADRHTVTAISDSSLTLNLLQTNSFDLILLDINMPKISGVELLGLVKPAYPSIEIIMLTALHDVRIAVDCMSKGAFYYITKPFHGDELVHIVRKALEHRSLRRENLVLRRQVSRAGGGDEIIGKSPALKNAVDVARRVAPSDSSVLLQGESGTGKELLAQLIYREGLRQNMPFIVMNCAAIPDTLIESELFGHEKGSFTNAFAMKQGLVELADGGTLFLDELGDISPVFQPKLLRFIQTGEFRRIGGTTTLHADVRFISATNKDLYLEAQQGKFREDLLYRLNVISVTVPPLRERKEDLPELIQHFMNRKLRPSMLKTFDSEAMTILLEHDWPGNVRELQNVVEGALVMSKGPVITADDLSSPNRFRKNTPSERDFAARYTLQMSLRDLEAHHIENVLNFFDWDKKSAAQALGISLKTLYNKIAESGLHKREE